MHFIHTFILLHNLPFLCIHPPFVKLHLNCRANAPQPRTAPECIRSSSRFQTCLFTFTDAVKWQKKRNINRNRQTWSCTALHKSRSAEVATPRQQTNKQTNKTAFRASRSLSELLCSLNEVFYSLMWVKIFCDQQKMSPSGLSFGQLLGYTATCWTGGSCAAAGL